MSSHILYLHLFVNSRRLSSSGMLKEKGLSIFCFNGFLLLVEYECRSVLTCLSNVTNAFGLLPISYSAWFIGSGYIV